MAEERTSGPRPSRAPLLNLDTLSERYSVTIDGQAYELRNPGELALLEYHRLGRKTEQLDAFMKDDSVELTDEQVESVDRLLDEVCRIVLVAPDEVHRRLKDLHKLQVIQAFNALPETAAPNGEGSEEAPRPSDPTGESTSLDSSGSTAATP